MNLRLKYIPFLLLAGMGYSEFAKAQNNSEIVMTPAELESFLANIANRKREQMTKRKQELSINQQINETLSLEKNQSNNTSASDERMYREFDRINSRIDMLMLNAGGNSGTTTMRAMSGTVPVQQPAAIMYQPNAPLQTYPNAYQYPNAAFGNPNSGSTTTIIRDNKSAVPAAPIQNDETRRLQGQINALNEEVRVLTQLGSAKQSTDDDDEIIALKARIEELKEDVANKGTNTIERTIVEKSPNDALTNSLKDVNQKIYFGNNSIVLSAADKSTLAQVAEIVKQNDPRVTVIIRGFASKRGSAQYNNALSFKRAEAVKKVLMSYGLGAKHLLTMHHGIDNSQTEEQARRVEVTFMVH